MKARPHSAGGYVRKPFEQHVAAGMLRQYFIAYSTSHTVPLWLQSQHGRGCRLLQPRTRMGNLLWAALSGRNWALPATMSCTTSAVSHGAVCTGRSIAWQSPGLIVDRSRQALPTAGIHCLVRVKVGFCWSCSMRFCACGGWRQALLPGCQVVLLLLQPALQRQRGCFNGCSCCLVSTTIACPTPL